MTDRLDRIERMLESLAANQIEEREARIAFREDLEILYQTVTQAAEAAEAGRAQAEADREEFRAQAEADRAQAEADREEFRAQAEADREEFRAQAEADRAQAEADREEFRAAIVGLQTNNRWLQEQSDLHWTTTLAEIRRIWTYLFEQLGYRGNGEGNAETGE